MGLMGLARRAGAARGAYMADIEAYNRGRQAILDQRAQEAHDKNMALTQQNMDNSLAAAQRAQEAHEQNMALTKQNMALTQQKMDNSLASARRAAYFHELRERAFNELPEEQKKMVLFGFNATANPENPGRNPGNPGRNPGNANGGKPPVSDAMWIKRAEAISPGMMETEFNNQFFDTDDKIQKRTGGDRATFMKNMADAYRAHILNYRENAMPLSDFIRDYAGKYRFWDKYDLERLIKARDSKETYGHWWTGYRTAEQEYARRNPAFFKDQNRLIREIDTGLTSLFGNVNGVPNFSYITKHNKNVVRFFDYYRQKGKDQRNAIFYAMVRDHAVRNNLDYRKIINAVSHSGIKFTPENFYRLLEKYSSSEYMK